MTIEISYLGLEEPNVCKFSCLVPFTKHSYVEIHEFSSNPGNRKTGVSSVVRTITVGMRHYLTCNEN